MWIVIFVTQNKETANHIMELLREAGLIVKLRTTGTKGNSLYGCFEILLPESEIEEGHKVLISNFF